MREILATQLKNAMKDGDKRRLSTIRLIQAAIKTATSPIAAPARTPSTTRRS